MAKVRDYLSLVKFAHSIFALPFALIALLVASRGQGELEWTTLGLVLVCMVCARNAAMAYNRLVDAAIDARNPRTAEREIPRQVISPTAAAVFVALNAGGFVVASALINEVCFYFSLPVLVVLLGYSHAKRFTALAHLWLGVGLGLSPLAAWIAVRGSFDGLASPIVLGAGVALWVMGFDILYSCQDEDFDREEGLHSIPSRFGRRTALRIAAFSHLLAVPLFFYFGLREGLGLAYHTGVLAAAVVLGIEHRVIKPTDMRRVNLAFFTMNGVVGLAMLVCTVLDIYLF